MMQRIVTVRTPLKFSGGWWAESYGGSTMNANMIAALNAEMTKVINARFAESLEGFRKQALALKKKK